MTKQCLGLEVTVWFYGGTYRLTINQETIEEKESADKLMNLPRDVTASILSRLGAAELLTRVQYVCREWRDICWDSLMWHHVRFDDIHTTYPYNYLSDLYFWPKARHRLSNIANWWPSYLKQLRPSRGHRLLDHLCRFAVDLSLGSMESITIRYFATDESLLYVAERCTKETLISVAAQVPFLEKLEFSYCYVRASVLEAFARCCPFLVSLEVVMRRNTHLSEVVRVIAQRMPYLAHLQLGGLIEDDELMAILDGCPRLESLDLYNCRGINFDGELGARCAKQIKELRLAHDPTDDIDFDDRSSLNYDSDYSVDEGYFGESEDDHDRYYLEYDDYDDIYLD